MSDFPLDPSTMNVFPNGGTVTPQIIATRDPRSSDQYPTGYFWFNSSSFTLWSQNGFSVGVPQWVQLPTSASSPTFAGGVTITNGNLTFGTAGNKIVAPAATTNTAGANSFGRVSMTAGVAVVTTTAITANSIVLLTTQTLGTVTSPKTVGVTARTAGTSFTITSADNTDTSIVGWEIIN